MGQGVMGGLGCSLLQMLAMTRFASSHQLVKDWLRCFTFLNYLCISVAQIQWRSGMGESCGIFEVMKDSMVIW